MESGFAEGTLLHHLFQSHYRYNPAHYRLNVHHTMLAISPAKQKNWLLMIFQCFDEIAVPITYLVLLTALGS